MNRKLLWWPVLAIGLALVIAPFALSLPSKASAGEKMLNGFEPIMQPSQVQLTADYYYNTFVPLGGLVKQMGPMAKQFPQLQKAAPVMARVQPGLDHYLPLVQTMQANVDNYKQVNSLPSFRLFTWFFVAPGILLVLLSGWALLPARVQRAAIHLGRPHPAA
jgi:hypothetical protein